MSDVYTAPDDELPPDDGDEFDDDPAPEADDELPPDEGDDEPAADDPPRRQESRAAREIRALRERAQAAERRAEIAEAVRQQTQPQPQRTDPAADEAAFQRSLAEMSPEQQIIAVRDRERGVVGKQMQGLEMQIAAIGDRAAFNDLKSDNPVARTHAAEIERQFKDWQDKGIFVTREVLLKNHLGELALKRGPQVRRRSERQAADQLQRERGRGGARRGDAPAQQFRRDDMSLAAIEARLKDVKLSDI